MFCASLSRCKAFYKSEIHFSLSCRENDKNGCIMHQVNRRFHVVEDSCSMPELFVWYIQQAQQKGITFFSRITSLLTASSAVQYLRQHCLLSEFSSSTLRNCTVCACVRACSWDFVTQHTDLRVL